MDEIDNPLVNVAERDSSIQLDIRYATENNAWGKQFYSKACAYLRKVATNSLIEVSKELRAEGFGLVLYDAYRPLSVTKLLWENTPLKSRRFVADPELGSIHNRGCAVDAALYRLEDGQRVPMPSGFDSMSEAAAADYKGGTVDERKNRDLLRSVMERHSFRVHPLEWWHFDHDSWHECPLLDVNFEDLL